MCSVGICQIGTCYLCGQIHRDIEVDFMKSLPHAVTGVLEGKDTNVYFLVEPIVCTHTHPLDKKPCNAHLYAVFLRTRARSDMHVTTVTQGLCLQKNLRV